MVNPMVLPSSDPEQLHCTLPHHDVLNLVQETAAPPGCLLELPAQNRSPPFNCWGSFGLECPQVCGIDLKLLRDRVGGQEGGQGCW